MDDNHPIKTKILTPLQSTMESFTKLKAMLEECVDIKSAKNNNYNINPDFDESLHDIN